MTSYARLFAIPVFFCVAISLTLASTPVGAAGFEVGENTPQSTARGGTGVANTSNPSAVYFNPALLGHVSGTQVMLSANILDLNVEFQRDDFYRRPTDEEPNRVFDPAQNQTGLFPVPFGTATFDVGPEDLSVGAGIFAPPAYGNPCFGTLDDDGCQPIRGSAARGMAVETDMIVAYAGVGVGYAIDLGDERQLDLGLTAAAAYQTSDFAVVVDSDTDISPPWREDPDNEAFVRGENLSGLAPTAILGIAYTDGPMRLAASYRPPMRWSLTGTADVEFSDLLEQLDASLTDDTLHLDTWHAGSLRLGWGVRGGEHPTDASRPRWDFEVNAVWENWSLVEHFRLEVDGDIHIGAFDEQYTFHPVYQRKGYQDTISLRTGFSFGINRWLTGHTGGFLETAAQPVAYTSADFVSWERYAGSIGATFHLPTDLDLDVGYTFINSPSRTVRNGEVYNPIPLSSCQGPDYDSDACQQRGTPPGNPQNEGEWSAHFQILSLGVTWKY